MMTTLRVELFFDDEGGNWHYCVPALRINGGGTSTREDAERGCLSADAFGLEGDPKDLPGHPPQHGQAAPMATMQVPALGGAC